MAVYRDITGQRFGKLIVVRVVGTSPRRYREWECECDCGNVVVTNYHALKAGNKKSCGCWAKTHGLCRAGANRSEYFRYLRYGITPQELELKMQQQDGKCSICGVDIVHSFHVDHDHASKKVRDLLCKKCNSLIAYAGEDVSVLERAVQYLNRH